MRQIRVAAPAVECRDDEEIITVVIGNERFRLVGRDVPDVRGLAAALHMARSVTLVLEEHPAFPVPDGI